MELEKIRQNIDQIDTQMKELFLARMDYSRQVAQAKRQTGGSVYVPEREAEIIKERTAGVEEEKLPEYRAFLTQVIQISRTYQYSKLAEGEEALARLPFRAARISLEFFCKNENGRLTAVLECLALAGISVERIREKSRSEDGAAYVLGLSGDFSGELARGAVLQVIKEMEQVSFSEK